MEKFIPLKGNIGKGFRNLSIVLCLIFFLLWFIHSEASRVHTDIYEKISVIEGRIK